MAKICEINGTNTRFINSRSKANNITNRKVYANLQTKKIYLPELNDWITLRASTSAFRTINKKGWLAVFKKAHAKGTLSARLHPLVSSAGSF
ncbi:MAG: 50S ribosomal protein L28 [Bacteroidota bacterium]